MKKCLTKKMLFREVSGCLVENPECCHAHKIGFSYECHHPEHTKFRADMVGAMTKKEVQELYSALKQKRREEFVESLDEADRNYFSCRNDLLGRPLAGRDLYRTIC